MSGRGEAGKGGKGKRKSKIPFDRDLLQQDCEDGDGAEVPVVLPVCPGCPMEVLTRSVYMAANDSLYIYI